MEKRILSTAEAAAYIGISEYTLRLARSQSPKRHALAFVPPPHVQTQERGRVVYLREDLEAWLKANKRQPEPRVGRPRKGDARNRDA